MMMLEDQFIVGYSVHQDRTDTWCMIEHLEKTKQRFDTLPANIIVDSGYGSAD
ncbi:hypothetical protein [Aneurinibacillus thermoaerophilus]|uniref:hypothetical protein n=1 Tax=Aneurinibacillus thermoaerophilus TaxID=143495 RepID=UPI002E249BBE|nr:hypothetical protein [Aneurinibacillus thermoaerophilus]